MKFLLKFLLPLATILGALTYALIPLVDLLTTKWFVRDLDIRSRLILNALKDDIGQLLQDNRPESRQRIVSLLRKTTQDERLMALAICLPNEQMYLKTELFPDVISCGDIRNTEPHTGALKKLPGGDVHIAFGYIENMPLSHAEIEGNSLGTSQSGGPVLGKLILLHDMSYALRRSDDTKTYLFTIFLAIGLLISAITVLVARWSMSTWIRSVRELVGGIRLDGIDRPNRDLNREFMPILADLKGLVRDLETSAREKDESQITWDAKNLKTILTQELSGEDVIVVSNRQPYIHYRKGDDIRVQSPASGLVTALEPILKACSGVWIAHGNGTADRDVVDKHDRVKVPPINPQYEIHRVWLNSAEERGYYYGFSNEGLWPLCHIAHTRPIFRTGDWEQYLRVNKKFTEAIIKDSKTEDPVVLVQDYHFALVPKMIREKLPKATILTFWHIPWPNPESFGICPWREEILDGLLGSSIVGFHTQFHCNNFIESVDRFLESRIDKETDSISFRGKVTEVRPYPISIEWPPERLGSIPNIEECRRAIQIENNLSEPIRIGVGIDRLDYTKGIIERFRAVERLLEMCPDWIGKFSFIQIAAPSRSSIEAYQHFDSDVRTAAMQINTKFGNAAYLPIILKIVHHEPNDVFMHLRAADICVVSSLHDGMNLVAKEFVAARSDERGVLILSMFAGASRELAAALIVNPYDADQTAAALNEALLMSQAEQQERMRALRAIVREYNVYRWAGRMLLDASRVRRRNRFAKRVRSMNANNEKHFPNTDFVGPVSIHDIPEFAKLRINRL